MDVGELSRTTPVSPFRREHDEIERVRRFHLEPGKAAPPRLVRRGERFRHESLVAAAERLLEKRFGGGVVGGYEPRHGEPGRRVGERAKTLFRGRIEEIG